MTDALHAVWVIECWDNRRAVEPVAAWAFSAYNTTDYPITIDRALRIIKAIGIGRGVHDALNYTYRLRNLTTGDIIMKDIL